MYEVCMQKNKDFSEKRCFFSYKPFRPDEVIVTIDKKCNGAFKTVGYISPSKIKEYESFRKNGHNDCGLFADLLVESMGVFFRDEIESREEKVSFLQSIIKNLNNEIAELNKHKEIQEAVLCEAGGDKLDIRL
jgi:hypothetical protein